MYCSWPLMAVLVFVPIAVSAQNVGAAPIILEYVALERSDHPTGAQAVAFSGLPPGQGVFGLNRPPDEDGHDKGRGGENGLGHRFAPGLGHDREGQAPPVGVVPLPPSVGAMLIWVSALGVIGVLRRRRRVSRSTLPAPG